MKKVDLLNPWQVRELQNWARKYVDGGDLFVAGKGINNFSSVSYANCAEVKIATGRAIDRATGKKILKGQLEVVFPFDWEDNSWTSRDFHVSVDTLLGEYFSHDKYGDWAHQISIL